MQNPRKSAFMSQTTPYDQLLTASREISLLASCAAVLSWDEQTYMPREGAQHRSAQLGLLAGMVHEKATDPRLGNWLLEAEQGGGLGLPDAPLAVNVREWRRAFDRATKLPKRLVEELARATSLGQQVWVEARAAASYARFQPAFEKILALKREEAACLGAGPADYDALLNDYEPGATAADLAPLFETLRQGLVPLIEAIAAAPRRPDIGVLKRDYPTERQRVFGEMVAAQFGFDFQRGRLDVTAHPFCTEVGPDDCRITTRYNPRDFSDAFFGILHETGHGLYEQGLDRTHRGTPMGEAVSLGVHESQSRLWENAVGRSRPFWRQAFPQAKRVFREALHDVSEDAFLFAVNEVKPSLIRVQADEVTYSLHIIIRFELERALLAGELSPADLPAAWAEKYQSYLKLTPGNDAEGCLQDIHWSAGLFGYFPTYTLGNVFAAQLFDRAQQDLVDLPQQIERGDFAGLLGWLREKIHRHGKRWRSTELVFQATGAQPSPQPFLAQLTRKFGELYGL